MLRQKQICRLKVLKKFWNKFLTSWKRGKQNKSVLVEQMFAILSLIYIKGQIILLNIMVWLFQYYGFLQKNRFYFHFYILTYVIICLKHKKSLKINFKAFYIYLCKLRKTLILCNVWGYFKNIR